MREFAGNNPLLLTAKELHVSIVARSRFDFLFCSYPPSGQMKKRERERGLFCIRSGGIDGLCNLKEAKYQSIRVKSNPLLLSTVMNFFHSTSVKMILLYDF